MYDDYIHAAMDDLHARYLVGALSQADYIARASSELAPILSRHMTRFDRFGLVADYWSARDQSAARWQLFIIRNDERIARRALEPS